MHRKGYDDVMDQWVLDEPKVCIYEDFIWIGKLITTKSYISMKDSLIKALHAKGPISKTFSLNWISGRGCKNDPRRRNLRVTKRSLI